MAENFKELIELLLEDRVVAEEIENHAQADPFYYHTDMITLDQEIKNLSLQKGKPETVTFTVSFSADVATKYGGGTKYGEIRNIKANVIRGKVSHLEILDLGKVISDEDLNDEK